MNRPNKSDFDENDEEDEKENATLKLTKRRPTEKQFKMIEDLFNQGAYSNVGNEGLDEVWAYLTPRLNEIGPPEFTQLEWRRKWSIYKYKAKKKMSDSEKRQSAAAQSKDISDGQIADSSSLPTHEENAAFRRDVLMALTQMSIKQDVIIANQEKILDKLGSSNCQPAQCKHCEQIQINKQQVPTDQPKKMLSTDPPFHSPHIIIIPGTDCSLITMFNAKDILQGMNFVTTEEKKAQGCTRESEVVVQRTMEIGTVPYRVIDNPAKLTPHEWSRVVAVFVSGSVSEFNGWPWDGNPVKIFSKICAFHLRYNDIKLDANIARWAVILLNLSRTERHSDRAVLMTFWESLDKHIAENRPGLLQ